MLELQHVTDVNEVFLCKLWLRVPTLQLIVQAKFKSEIEGEVLAAIFYEELPQQFFVGIKATLLPTSSVLEVNHWTLAPKPISEMSALFEVI